MSAHVAHDLPARRIQVVGLDHEMEIPSVLRPEVGGRDAMLMVEGWLVGIVFEHPKVKGY